MSIKVKVLNKIDKLISKIESQRKAKALAEREENKKSKQKFQELLKLEKEKHQEKIELLNKILNWAYEFSKSSRFKKILKIIDDDELEIYSSGWEHIQAEIPKKAPGFWARLFIDKKGRLEYKSGYKWMGFRACFYLNKESIGRIKYEYLCNVWHYIDSGIVYHGIEDEIKKLM